MNKNNLQEQLNWCWAAACVMVGQQYKQSTLGVGCHDTDISQESVVQHANTIMPGVVGNFPGDDEAKIRGLKYVVTGACNSDLIEVVNLGTYDMAESLMELYRPEIESVFKTHNYIIGNAVLLPQGICHSFVLMGIEDNRIQIFDPWNAGITMYPLDEVFVHGFLSERGLGAIKWIQYISQ